MNKAKKFIASCLSALALISTGCSGLTNLTPERVPENASRVYTLSMSAYINDGSVVQDSIKPFVVIDEQTNPDEGNKGYEVRPSIRVRLYPPQRAQRRKILFPPQIRGDKLNRRRKEGKGNEKPHSLYAQPATRYIVNMQNERRPVGASIPVLGRGFDKEDRIRVGGVFADTEYLSRSTLNFIVPPLESGKTYDVELVGEKGEIWIGAFRVDTAKMGVSPSEIKMAGGDIVTMIFNIGF